MGVNLPARLVVIKGTEHYYNGKTESLSMSMLMQMAGRAGRAGLDNKGTAFVMATRSQKTKYDALLGKTAAVESRLHTHTIEHINAEVVLLTITSREVVIDWLRTTFFWIRVHKNPPLYDYASDMPKEELDSILSTKCDALVSQLVQANCVRSFPSDKGCRLEATAIGKSMAKCKVNVGAVCIAANFAARCDPPQFDGRSS